MDQFEAYFKRADLDQDGRISGAEAVSFFQGSGLPQQVLAQVCGRLILGVFLTWVYMSHTEFELGREDLVSRAFCEVGLSILSVIHLLTVRIGVLYQITTMQF